MSSSLAFEVLGGGVKPFSLPVLGRCEVPTINSDPRNVFMKRVKTRGEAPVSKKFVMSKEVYEFGPLLAWKGVGLMEEVPVAEEEKVAEDGGEQEEKEKEKEEDRNSPRALAKCARETNMEYFRISNNGNFPTTVTFEFRGPAPKKVEGNAAEETEGNAAEGEAEAAEPPPPPPEGVFHVSPSSIHLASGDTFDVSVWAFPPSPGELYEARLVASLENSPFETSFDVSALGAKPSLEMKGGWSEMADVKEMEAEAITINKEIGANAGANAEDNAREGEADDDEEEEKLDEETNEANKSLKASLLSEATLLRSNPVADFDRLLLGRSEESDFILKNSGVVPLDWNIDASDLDDIAEFRISPTRGTLLPGESSRVVIGFEAITEKELSPSITVHYTDVEGGGVSGNEQRCFETTLQIKAEAYSIKAVAFEEDDESNDGVIDFGNLRVGDAANNKFSLRNRGKYEISYDFSFKGSTVAQFFKIEPMTGKIEPGGAAEVNVTFDCKVEVSLKNNRDIRCVVTEPHTGEAVEHFSVSVSVASFFSRIRLQPARGLNFGAVKFNEEVSTFTGFSVSIRKANY